MRNLKARIEAIERAVNPQSPDTLTVIHSCGGEVAHLEAQDGQKFTRRAGETERAFIARAGASCTLVAGQRLLHGAA